MYEGDSINIPQKIIPDETENQEPEVAKKEPVEEAKKAVEETPNEADKNSDATDCCCMVAPWKIEQEGRNYTLDMTELYVNPDGSKTARELISKEQDKKEHELYVIAPPRKDGAMQFKKINVNYEFMRKNQKCELMMLAESEKYREDVEVKSFFEINSLGRLKGAEHIKSDKIEELNFPHKSIDGEGSKSYRYHEKKQELDRLYAQYKRETKPFWKDYILGQIENKEIELEMFLGVYDENTIREGSIKHLIYNILGLNGISNVIEVYPWGSNKCKTQLVAEIHVLQKSVYKGEVTASFASQYTTAKAAKRESKQRNERIDIVRKGFRYTGKIDYEYGDTHYILDGAIGKNLDAEGNKTTDNVKRKFTKRVNAQDIFKKQKSKVAKVIGFLDGLGGSTSINTGVTKFTLKVEGSHDEDPDGYELQKVITNFEIELALFDGSSFSVDMLAWALKKGGPIGNLLALAKGYAEDKGQELKVEFSMGGKLSGSLKYTRTDPKKSWLVDSEAKINGSINLEIIASIKIDGSVLWIKVTVGAYIKSGSKATEENKTEISAAITAKVNEKDELLVNGSFEFNGLTIYAASFIEVGVNLNNTDKDQNNSVFDNNTNAEIDLKREHKASGKLPCLDEWKPEPTQFFSVKDFLK
jgi:hypothetical protein